MSGNKKNIILEAVLDLINEKHETSSLKIADIATKANIGKGTVYEYFKNKEELLANAFMYMIENKIIVLVETIESGKSFKENYVSLFKKIDTLMDSHIYFIKCLFMNESAFVFNKSVNNMIEKSTEKIEAYFEKVISKLNNQGISESIISPDNDKFDVFVAVNNSIMCLWLYKMKKPMFDKYSLDEIIKKSYSKYLKLLNK